MAATGNCCYHPERAAEAVCRICGAELCGECAQGAYCICPKHQKPTTLWRAIAILLLLALLPLGYWIATISRPSAIIGAQDFANQTAKGVLERVKVACGEYAKDVGRYPTQGEGLEALVKGKKAVDTPEIAQASPAVTKPSEATSPAEPAKMPEQAKGSDLIPGWRGPYLPVEMWDAGFPDSLGGKVQYGMGKELFSHDGKIRLLLDQPPPKRETRPEATKKPTG